MLKRIKNIGPGALIAAAFIGPGTVTACTLAGANFGYTLLWALLFATVATIILQEMSARLGLVTQQGLGETLRIMLSQSIWKWPLFGLVMFAGRLGNFQYQVMLYTAKESLYLSIITAPTSPIEAGIP